MPRVAVTISGVPQRFIQPSMTTAASAPRSSRSRKCAISSPADSSSPSQTKRKVTGSPPSHELLGRLQLHPELALVVGDAARVEPLAADGRLERIGLPELERVGSWTS